MKNRAYLIALAAIAAACATWLYASREIDRQKVSLAAKRARLSRLQQSLADLQRQRDEALHTTTEVERELEFRSAASGTSSITADPARQAQTKAWLASVKRLKQSFADLPAQSIPELKLLTDLDWLTLARTLSGESELELRKARSAARKLAIPRFTRSLGSALNAYTAANEGTLPTDIAQLIPYFKTSVEPELLQRYTMTASGNIRTTKGEVIGERAPVDDELDPYHMVTVKGSPSASDSWAESQYQRAAMQAIGDFTAAHPGQSPKTAAELAPYVRDLTARPIVEAMAEFEREQRKSFASYEQLRPYVRDPATRAFLEKLVAAAQKNRSP